MKGSLVGSSALGLPQLQHLLCCGVAGSISYYTLSAKIQLPEWQSKLKRKNSCWWDSWLCDGPQQNKTWWEGKAKHLCSFEKNLHGCRLAKGFIQQFTKAVIHSAALHMSAAVPVTTTQCCPQGSLTWAGGAAAVCPYFWGTGSASRGTVNFSKNKGNGEYLLNSVIAEAIFLLHTFLFEFGLTILFKTECNHQIN